MGSFEKFFPDLIGELFEGVLFGLADRIGPVEVLVLLVALLVFYNAEGTH